MKFIGDFHIHSKYSRAVSPLMDLENLDRWAEIKGIKVMGTGDFTHPKWFSEIKEKLEPAEPGLFKLRGIDSATRFILTTEISCIYKKTPCLGLRRAIHPASGQSLRFRRNGCQPICVSYNDLFFRLYAKGVRQVFWISFNDAGRIDRSCFCQ